MFLNQLTAEDPQVADAIEQELSRQRSSNRINRFRKLCFSCGNGGNGFSPDQ